MDRTFADCLRVGHGYDACPRAGAAPEALRSRPGALQGMRGHSDAATWPCMRCAMPCSGAAALGDIGLHFPDTAAEYAGIDSMVLLERCMNCWPVKFGVVNADVTIASSVPGCAALISTPCAGAGRGTAGGPVPRVGHMRRPERSASSAARRWRPMPWC